MHLLGRIERVVALIIAAALPLAVLLQMTDRFIFGGTLQLGWTEEIARILMVWLTFWGAALVQAENSHIRLELFDRYLPPRVQVVISLVVDSAVLCFLIAVIATGVPFSIHEWGMALPGTGLPRSIFALAVVVGSILMVLHLMSNIVVKCSVTRFKLPLRRW